MFDGNIDGFLRMSGKSDGTGSAPQRFGDYKTRRNNIERFMARLNGVDPETGEVLNFKPSKTARNPYKMAYRSYGNNPFKGVNLPKPATVINLALIGGVALIGYKLYSKFFGGSDNIISDAIDNAKVNGAKSIAKTVISTDQAKADSITSTQTSLAAKGITVSSTSASLANTFHDWLDSVSVDHDKIVNTILKMDVQTFRLMSVSYGSRELTTYARSPLHMFNSDTFLGNTLGTLKDHLKIVLYASELTKIHAYYSVI